MMGSSIKAIEEKALLGVRIDNDVTFTKHVTSISCKANQKLHALIGGSKYVSLQKRCILTKSFITLQFNYCPIVRKCHSRSRNNKVNNSHEKDLCIFYQDFQWSFSALLVKDNSFTIFQKNLKLVAI